MFSDENQRIRFHGCLLGTEQAPRSDTVSICWTLTTTCPATSALWSHKAVLDPGQDSVLTESTGPLVSRNLRS